jgi:hypothetical protein
MGSFGVGTRSGNLGSSLIYSTVDGSEGAVTLVWPGAWPEGPKVI